MLLIAVWVLDMAVLFVACSRAGVIALAGGMTVPALSCIKGKRDRIVAVMMLAVAVADAVLSDNPSYLYSRAVTGYYAGEYDSSLADARASSSRLASYDTEMLLGGVFRELGQPDSSEVHFRKAAAMCPSRISPLYYLFLLYVQEDSRTFITLQR